MLSFVTVMFGFKEDNNIKLERENKRRELVEEISELSDNIENLEKEIEAYLLLSKNPNVENLNRYDNIDTNELDGKEDELSEMKNELQKLQEELRSL